MSKKWRGNDSAAPCVSPEFNQSSAATPDQPTSDDPSDRLRRLTVRIVAIMMASGLAVGLAARIRFDNIGTDTMAEFFAALVLTSTRCSRDSSLSRVGDLAGIVALISLSAIVGGLISLIGLSLRMPLIDHQLLAADRLVGLDPVEIVRWLSQMPPLLLAGLDRAYNWTAPAILICVTALVMRRERIEAWRAAFCFTGGLLTVCAIALFNPARGLGSWIQDADLARLPPQSARYFWDSFDAFYLGDHPVLRVYSIDGVISFPSFHTVMGLIALAMWRHRPAVAVGVALWAVPMFLATLPIGGHYVIDLIGGVAVWALWFGWSLRIAPAPSR